jgi:hypothetical protein
MRIGWGRWNPKLISHSPCGLVHVNAKSYYFTFYVLQSGNNFRQQNGYNLGNRKVGWPVVARVNSISADAADHPAGIVAYARQSADDHQAADLANDGLAGTEAGRRAGAKQLEASQVVHTRQVTPECGRFPVPIFRRSG